MPPLQTSQSRTRVYNPRTIPRRKYILTCLVQEKKKRFPHRTRCLTSDCSLYGKVLSTCQAIARLTRTPGCATTVARFALFCHVSPCGLPVAVRGLWPVGLRATACYSTDGIIYTHQRSTVLATRNRSPGGAYARHSLAPYVERERLTYVVLKE